MSYTVGPKGQVVIAKEIRTKLGVKPGWVAFQRIAGDHVEVHFYPPGHNKSLAGILAPYGKRGVPSRRAWDEARAAAWTADWIAGERRPKYGRRGGR